MKFKGCRKIACIISGLAQAAASRYDIRADTLLIFHLAKQFVRPIIPFWAEKMKCCAGITKSMRSYPTISIHLPENNCPIFASRQSGRLVFKFVYSIFDEAEKSIWMPTEENKLGCLLQISLLT
jgi:hypothetical protein